MKLTVDEYSKRFKMSKEMINSKLKSKRLNYIIEDGITYINIPDTPAPANNSSEQRPITKAVTKQRATVATVLSLYQRENAQLKEKITQLELKIDKLIDDKEQMLRDEIKKIEHVYSTKDEQLKTILELVNAKLMMENSDNHVHDVQSIPNTHTALQEENKVVELRDYLKSLGLSSSQRKVIKKRFLSVYDNDVRILKQNGKLYLDFSRYDYSDLLAY